MGGRPAGGAALRPDLRPRRLLLSTGELESLRRQVLPAPLSLPPGFALEPAPGADADVPPVEVDPVVADDLRVLALPELAVTVRARRPGLEVTACLALSGPRGASLLRTGDTAVQLSVFPAAALADELTTVVPTTVTQRRPRAQQVPLDALLSGGAGTRLAGGVDGVLHATVVGGARPGRQPGVVGSVEWVWDGGGWVGLEPLPSRQGRPWVALVPVTATDLGAWVAPLVAQAAA